MKVTNFLYFEDLVVVRYAKRPPASNGLLYLWRDYRVMFELDGKNQIYTVPAGTWTDFASIPQPIQGLISKLGGHIEAAVVHDHMCQVRGPWSSRTAADIFLAGMEAAGVPALQRQIMYNAVVMFGPQWGAPRPSVAPVPAR